MEASQETLWRAETFENGGAVMKLSDKTLIVLWTLRQWGWDIFAVVLIAILAVLVCNTNACKQRTTDDEVIIQFWTYDGSPLSSEANQCIEPPGYVHDNDMIER